MNVITTVTTEELLGSDTFITKVHKNVISVFLITKEECKIVDLEFFCRLYAFENENRKGITRKS